jgi:adenosine deaminase
VIICGIRNIWIPPLSLKQAELAIAVKNKGVYRALIWLVVELQSTAKDHKDAFDLALKTTLNITIHAGE